MQHIQDIRLIVKCCTMYYYEGISQLEISRQLGISHPTVCRLIKQARDMGIVRIDVVSPLEQEDHTALERELERRFSLKEAVVISDKLGDDGLQKEELGKTAAEYLQRILGKKSVVGVSLGTSLKGVHEAVQTPLSGDHIFVPIIGGVGQNLLEVQANELVNSYAKKFGGHALFLHAPSYVNNAIIKETLLEEHSVQEVLEYYDKLDACVVGIGVPEPGCVLMRTGFYSDETIDRLFSEGMVGDICLQFFDINGDHHRFDVNNHIFAMELDRLKEVERSIAIVTGVSKTKAVIGAMRAKFINVLITHRALAESILNYKD